MAGAKCGTTRSRGAVTAKRASDPTVSFRVTKSSTSFRNRCFEISNFSREIFSSRSEPCSTLTWSIRTRFLADTVFTVDTIVTNVSFSAATLTQTHTPPPPRDHVSHMNLTETYDDSGRHAAATRQSWEQYARLTEKCAGTATTAGITVAPQPTPAPDCTHCCGVMMPLKTWRSSAANATCCESASARSSEDSGADIALCNGPAAVEMVYCTYCPHY